MNYKGFTILHDKLCNTWRVKVDFYTEFLAFDEKDAKRQIDNYIKRISLRKAA